MQYIGFNFVTYSKYFIQDLVKSTKPAGIYPPWRGPRPDPADGIIDIRKDRHIQQIGNDFLSVSSNASVKSVKKARLSLVRSVRL